MSGKVKFPELILVVANAEAAALRDLAASPTENQDKQFKIADDAAKRVVTETVGERLPKEQLRLVLTAAEM